MVPGHEIIGNVKEIGSAVTKFSVGEKAGVGVYVDSCRTCANCLLKESNYCLEGMTGTYNAKERDGSGITQGGYSNCIVVNEDYVLHVPENLDSAGAAPLLCAGGSYNSINQIINHQSSYRYHTIFTIETLGSRPREKGITSNT